MNCSQRDGGQVGIDFLTGVTIFIFALFFLFNFITTSVMPFTTEAGVSSASVNQASERLYSDILTSEDKPRGVINESVAKDYFSDNDESEMKEDLGIRQVRHLNVTVTDEDGGVYTWNAGSEEMSVGEPMPEVGTFDSESRMRVAYMEGEDSDQTVHLTVRVR